MQNARFAQFGDMSFYLANPIYFVFPVESSPSEHGSESELATNSALRPVCSRAVRHERARDWHGVHGPICGGRLSRLFGFGIRLCTHAKIPGDFPDIALDGVLLVYAVLFGRGPSFLLLIGWQIFKLACSSYKALIEFRIWILAIVIPLDT